MENIPEKVSTELHCLETLTRVDHILDLNALYKKHGHFQKIWNWTMGITSSFIRFRSSRQTTIMVHRPMMKQSSVSLKNGTRSDITSAYFCLRAIVNYFRKSLGSTLPSRGNILLIILQRFGHGPNCRKTFVHLVGHGSDFLRVDSNTEGKNIHCTIRSDHRTLMFYFQSV